MGSLKQVRPSGNAWPSQPSFALVDLEDMHGSSVMGHSQRERELRLVPSTDIAELSSNYSCCKKARDHACSR
jgi:hypothetical protein